MFLLFAVVAEATPLYNTLLRLEVGARERHLDELFAAGQECPGIRDAVRLCKVWLKQRHLEQVKLVIVRSLPCQLPSPCISPICCV